MMTVKLMRNPMVRQMEQKERLSPTQSSKAGKSVHASLGVEQRRCRPYEYWTVDPSCVGVSYMLVPKRKFGGRACHSQAYS